MSRPMGSSAELERRRRWAPHLLNQGKRQVDVADFLGVDRTSIYRWRRQAAGNPDRLAAKPHPHRPPLLTTAQLQTLETLLAQGALVGQPNGVRPRGPASADHLRRLVAEPPQP